MIKTIVVCGAGTMGRSIAQLAAQNQYSVILFDVQSNTIQQANGHIENDLQRLVDKSKLSVEEKQKVLENIHFTTDIKDCIGDLVIEAVVEILDIKVDLLKTLQIQNSAETIFTSNTSSIPISSIAENLERVDRVAGLHFFNPATIMKLVEVVQTANTSEAVINELMEFSKSLQKTPVLCKDAPGFIVNHVARPYYLESLYIHEKGASLEQIDALLENVGFKMGPFRLLDLIGNDINYAVSDIVYHQLDKPARLKPSIIQKSLVENGNLGRKTGKGFYEYK